VAVHPSVVEQMDEEERENVIQLTIKFLQSQHPQLKFCGSYRYI
jgi:hypothetical protein